jgi:alpha-galactosidase
VQYFLLVEVKFKGNEEMTTINRRQMMGLSLAGALVQPLPRPISMSAIPALPRSVLSDRPGMVRAFLGNDATLQNLQVSANRWSGGGVEVHFLQTEQTVRLTLTALSTPVHRIHIRWPVRVAEKSTVLGDAWERSYGELAWLPLQADRVLPWYFVAKTEHNCTGVGVKTGAGAFAFWQLDAEGISLWLDVRNGGEGVLLGDRVLDVATIVTASGDDCWSTTKSLCAEMVSDTKIAAHRGKYPVHTIYGSNDWYYAYGKNNSQGILRDAALMRELAPASGPRPFTVIDDGYQDPIRFPSLPRLAEDIRRLEVGPGIWIRPTRAEKNAPASLLLPKIHWAENTDELVYDPTIDEARTLILRAVEEACAWGYDFIKHDFTTYELLGQWGSRMGASPTRPGWSFHERNSTNAEIILALYRDIRRTAGEDRLVLGCNTVGHLSAGIFDAQRTGDDVSGRVWDRTRQMGVNTLAFRLPQHGQFFAVDADCIPITPDVPWKLTEAWLEAVAASGSVLLVSPDPRSMGAEQKQAVRRAFANCLASPSSQPLDWMESRTPSNWHSQSGTVNWDWLEKTGASPFAS